MTDWAEYLHTFHAERPGITEALLRRCIGQDGSDPYQWLTQPFAGADRVIDLGCGSGPTASSSDRWVGLDVSFAELLAARASGRGPLVVAKAEAVPVGSGSVTLVSSVMSLMVVDDPGAVLGEAARVLSVGGHLALLLPAARPVSLADGVRYGALLIALGRSAMPVPQAELDEHLLDMIDQAGFQVMSDDRARFAYPMRSRRDADLLVDSLYLHDISARRVRIARGLARRWGHGDLGVPLRRVVAVRT